MFLQWLCLILIATCSVMATTQPKALVWRSSGAADCDGCAEAAAQLLRTSPSNFSVDFVGPNETIPLTADSLNGIDIYVQPGGGGLDEGYAEMKPYRNIIRNFVSNGGRYLGFCLGAYLAGSGPGFNMMPSGTNTDEETEQPGAQVTTLNDTVIQVDWTFGSSPRTGQTADNVWLYFQDGAVLDIPEGTPGAKILARYSSNNDTAAAILPFGKGWLGLVGPHPEAPTSWYQDYNITNPDGIDYAYGWDLVETTYNWKRGTTNKAGRRF